MYVMITTIINGEYTVISKLPNFLYVGLTVQLQNAWQRKRVPINT